MQPATIVGSLVGAAVVLVWRIRETKRPVTGAKLLLPPLGMATGFSMFVVPAMRVPVLWGVVAFVVGASLLSIALIHTSHLTREGDAVMMRRSRVFLVVLLGLVALRLLLRSYVEQYASPSQTAALFFILAFGMLLPWRITMYLRYRKLVASAPAPKAPDARRRPSSTP